MGHNCYTSRCVYPPRFSGFSSGYTPNLPQIAHHSLLEERNRIIRARHEAGESQADLAREFGLSYQRVHQIIHSKRK